MAFKGLRSLFAAPAFHLSREDAMKVFTRDHFRCQYCGLDGLHRFENWLVLTVDHVHPHAKGGARAMTNLVTACQPCNMIKGHRVYKSFAEAKEFVLAKREQWREVFQKQVGAGPHKPSH